MIKTERQIDKIIEQPVIGRPCLIQMNHQILRTSIVENFYHNLLTNTWKITTKNSIYYC